ncbi:hypothetical protein U1Q18_012147 [Sarracenia purpurea var. burkii]
MGATSASPYGCCLCGIPHGFGYCFGVHGFCVICAAMVLVMSHAAYSLFCHTREAYTGLSCSLCYAASWLSLVLSVPPWVIVAVLASLMLSAVFCCG